MVINLDLNAREKKDFEESLSHVKDLLQAMDKLLAQK